MRGFGGTATSSGHLIRLTIRETSKVHDNYMSQQISRTIVDAPRRRDLANAIRALSMDAVQAANSGHPGMPMGMADMAEVLWNDFMKHNPANPLWTDRDRFVLSNGHGSMLLYSLLHLSGYPLTIDELRNFRQFGYRTAGHPEREPDIGIETTTGPLGTCGALWPRAAGGDGVWDSACEEYRNMRALE